MSEDAPVVSLIPRIQYCTKSAWHTTEIKTLSLCTFATNVQEKNAYQSYALLKIIFDAFKLLLNQTKDQHEDTFQSFDIRN
jgi:hypothetical protein